MATFDAARVGDALVTPVFTLAPSDVTSYLENTWLASAAEYAGPSAGGPEVWAGPYPGVGLSAGRSRQRRTEAVLNVASKRALGHLWEQEIFRGPRRTIRWQSEPRVLTYPVVGQPLLATATIRHRTRQNHYSGCLTIDVELRREGGALLASFGVAIELVDPRRGRARELRRVPATEDRKSGRLDPRPWAA